MTWNYITKVIDSNYTIQQVCDENLFILPDIMCQMFFLENTYSVCMGQVYAWDKCMHDHFLLYSRDIFD